jgi:hypothetical protein
VLIKAQVEFLFFMQELSEMKDEATIDLLQAGARKARILFLPCNTPGVCHSLSSGFKLKHDRLSGDDDVKVNLWR